MFARGTRLWGSDDWPSEDPDRGLACFADLLAALVAVPADERPDGAVLELPDLAAGATIRALTRTTRAVLLALSQRDPAGERCMDAPIEDRDWWFTFASQPFFVVTFAPCYGPDSSR